MKKGFAEPSRTFRFGRPVPAKAGLSRTPAKAKRAVNVSVDADLLTLAKEMKINLSQLLQNTLRDATADERARRFYKENKTAIDSYNRLIERQGTLAEAFYGQDGSHEDPAV